MRYLNTCTTLPIAHATTKLQAHIEKMNNDGWEILSVSIDNIGIEELFVIFWKKPRE